MVEPGHRSPVARNESERRRSRSWLGTTLALLMAPALAARDVLGGDGGDGALRIRGVVFDGASAEPVSGATVSIQPTYGTVEDRERGPRDPTAWKTVTDANGAFECEVERSRRTTPFIVTVEAAQFVQEWQIVEGDRSVRVGLARSDVRMISGRVVFDDDGAGVHPFSVGVLYPARGHRWGLSSSTGPQGEFVIRNTDAGPVWLAAHGGMAASDAGALPAFLGPVAPGTRNLTIVVRRGAAIIGRILDDELQPVAGAAVYAEERSAESGYWMPGGISDAEGRFEVRGVGVGACVVRVKREPWPMKWVAGVRAGGDAANFVLGPARGISGRIRDVGDKEVRVGAVVPAAIGIAGALYPLLADASTVNASGEFAIEGLAPGDYRLYYVERMDGAGGTEGARSRDGTESAGWRAVLGAERVPAGTRDLELRLERGVSVKGRAIAAGGETGLRNHEIVVSSSGRRLWGSVRSRADGSFEISVPDRSATWDLEVRGAGRRLAFVSGVGQRVEPIMIPVGATASCGGRVRFPSGVGAARVRVRLVERRVENPYLWEQEGCARSEASTDENGEFEAHGLTPGEYSVFVEFGFDGDRGIPLRVPAGYIASGTRGTECVVQVGAESR